MEHLQTSVQRIPVVQSCSTGDLLIYMPPGGSVHLCHAAPLQNALSRALQRV